MVPNAEKTDRMSSSVRSRWMLARYNLKTRALNSLLQSTVIILNQPVVTLCLSHNFINAGLGLGHLARPTHLKKEVITGNLSIFLKYCFSSFKHCIRILWYSCHRREFRSSGREQVVLLLVVRTQQRQSPAEGKLASRGIIYYSWRVSVVSWPFRWILKVEVSNYEPCVCQSLRPNSLWSNELVQTAETPSLSSLPWCRSWCSQHRSWEGLRIKNWVSKKDKVPPAHDWHCLLSL